VTTYRTGNHWGVTIVREGDADAICADDRCPDRGDHLSHDGDQLVAVVTNGDKALARRIAWLLTHTCPTCMGPSRETVGMVCQTCGTDYAPEAVIHHG
jgi:hypothetical protein